jgi:hypothetical protein
MQYDLREVSDLLLRAKKTISEICKDIYIEEVEIDDLINNIANESRISLSNEAIQLFKIAESINSVISDISDAEINNSYIISPCADVDEKCEDEESDD